MRGQESRRKNVHPLKTRATCEQLFASGIAAPTKFVAWEALRDRLATHSDAGCPVLNVAP